MTKPLPFSCRVNSLGENVNGNKVTQSRTLTLKEIYKGGEEKAYRFFCKLRWPETDGKAGCPRCGCTEAYDIATRWESNGDLASMLVGNAMASGVSRVWKGYWQRGNVA